MKVISNASCVFVIANVFCVFVIENVLCDDFCNGRNAQINHEAEQNFNIKDFKDWILQMQEIDGFAKIMTNFGNFTHVKKKASIYLSDVIENAESFTGSKDPTNGLPHGFGKITFTHEDLNQDDYLQSITKMTSDQDLKIHNVEGNFNNGKIEGVAKMGMLDNSTILAFFPPNTVMA